MSEPRIILEEKHLLLAWLLAVVIVLELFLLYSSTSKTCRGYFFPGIKGKAPFLSVAISLRWLLAAVVLESLPRQFHNIIFTAFIGAIVVLVPHEIANLIGKNVTLKTLKKPLLRISKMLTILTQQAYLNEIQTLKEQDNFDCQNLRGWWDTGLSRLDTRRRIRLIYESCKEEIARRRRSPAYLKHDVGISAGQKFYLLVELLGRNELKRRLENPPCFDDWDGRERRRVVGTRGDRRNPDPGGPSRIGDGK